MKRTLVLAAAIALGAGGLGLVVGFALDDPKAPKPLRRARPTLLVSSRWDYAKDGARIHIVSGALASDPRRGFVLFQAADTSLDQNPAHKVQQLVNAEPRFFTTPDRSGPLHLVSSSRWAWVLESREGSRSVLDLSTPDAQPAFYFIGKQLDPAKLPELATSGLAAPVVYGPVRRQSKAVLLVGRTARGEGWTLYGYLPGFSLPPAATVAETLRRPLRGPGRALFRIDSRARKLVRIGVAAPTRAKPWTLPPRCSTWSGNENGSYVACDDSIVLVRPDGSRTTLLRQDVAKTLSPRWTFLEPSPNGRTLLLEQDQYACGTSRQTFLLSTRGKLEPVIGRVLGSEDLQSEPLGWLSDNTALVAVQNNNGCEGTLRSGIYRIWPDIDWGQLVVATSSEDATLWGADSR